RLAARDLPLLHFAAALVIALVFMPGQAWLRAATNRLVLRRRHHQQAALQAFLPTLSPELGTLECCRRALAELVRVRQGPGEAFQVFVAQLALLLDGADLLARTVAVERSLAHAEKLAALGELAARIAHEIRNPVTAARSLAQQLSREPGLPWVAEHRLILEELERVERRVGELLRFARRDELRFE